MSKTNTFADELLKEDAAKTKAIEGELTDSEKIYELVSLHFTAMDSGKFDEANKAFQKIKDMIRENPKIESLINDDALRLDEQRKELEAEARKVKSKVTPYVEFMTRFLVEKETDFMTGTISQFRIEEKSFFRIKKTEDGDTDMEAALGFLRFIVEKEDLRLSAEEEAELLEGADAEGYFHFLNLGSMLKQKSIDEYFAEYNIYPEGVEEITKWQPARQGLARKKVGKKSKK